MNENPEREKKLLREIHHRVKNNLQVINSLFELQLMEVKDDSVRTALAEGAGRLGVVSVVYKNLSAEQYYSIVDFEKVAIEIFNQISHSYLKIDPSTKCTIRIPDLILDVDNALPLALIMNELFMNSFTQFSAGQGGREISVQLTSAGDEENCIQFHDSAIHYPDGFDLNDRNLPLGMRLISGLSRQLGGHAEYQSENGGTFKIFFRKK